MKRLSCAILEDQRPAQKILIKYIEDADTLDLKGVFGSAAEAAHALPAAAVDLLFLDLHLPKMDGFPFLKTLTRPPLVIVTTADADQAIEGYAHNVVDYLLKPFSFDRFLQAIEKARQQSVMPSDGAIESRDTVQSHDLFVKSHGEIRRIPVENIQFIRAESDYVELYTEDERFFFASTLQSLLKELPTHLFARVHKSYIINIRQISRIVGTEVHIGGTTVPIGRSYKEGFLQRISIR
ncbi:MAG: LytTR family DNA-binding domain-containing protein [Pseudomonadota bacterium]